MTTAVQSQSRHTVGGGVGAYKDVAVSSINHETELKGTATSSPASYPDYLPVWDNEKGQRYPPLTPFEHYEHGKDADPTFPNLLGRDVTVEEITGSIGAEVKGVQLSQLSDAGKDELALLVAQKKVVAFRDQDFANQPIEKALEYCRYFGRLHIHQASGAPRGYPEVHLVHRGAEDTSFQDFLQERTNSIQWHSDVTHENQPPGTTFLYALDVPKSGGDTLFLNQVKAYERLSPAFRERLSGLKAVHSGHEQAESSLKRGGILRRDAISSIHPLGESAVFLLRPYANILCSPNSSCDWGESVVRQPTVHQIHRWLQEGRERLPSQVPVRPHGLLARCPMPSQMGAWYGCGVGQPCYCSFAIDRLGDWR